ncbi:alpha/beta-hydrolase [Linderina pennispora]|uniref:Alpha/beta-hydrolase n=1 Tax=Linderina pennispora TaxID=61395 RepID=A0A1Y1VXX4_9FUNG|nr:alpha/beta-hydrolase [Linderina pennispora]ORX66128.1 alpha/beta-hydrolase [Linderina pennispora]
MSLTNASRQFVTRETLVGTHEFAGMPAVNRGSDPLPRLFCFPVRTDAGGWDLLFGHVYLPPDFAAGKLYPVVVNAYGGPQCQLVTNAYPYPRHRRLAMLTRMTPEIVKPGTTPMFAPRGSSCQSSISDIDDRRVDSAESVGPSMEKSGVHSTVVVCVDGRGTPNRGLAYESAIGGRLGQLEVDDIASAVEYLLEYGLDALAPVDTPPPSWCQTTVSCSNSSHNVPRPPVFPAPASCADSLSEWDMAPLPDQRTGFVDHRRIAIHGWSYGGYIALRAIAKHPSLFKVCIAGAPVVRWDWYSAAYAERYLGVPAAGQTIYDQSFGRVGCWAAATGAQPGASCAWLERRQRTCHAHRRARSVAAAGMGEA